MVVIFIIFTSYGCFTGERVHKPPPTTTEKSFALTRCVRFPVVAVTNHHKHNLQLKNADLFSYSPGGRMSEISSTELKSKCWLVWFLLESHGQSPFLASSRF